MKRKRSVLYVNSYFDVGCSHLPLHFDSTSTHIRTAWTPRGLIPQITYT